MNGNNMFNNGQQQQFYPYGYNAAPIQVPRVEMPAYMVPQQMAPVCIKGRPVSSFEEARVAQVDLDGSTFIFPDLGNKKIYTKRINADGTATLQSFVLETEPAVTTPKYATIEEVESLRDRLNEILAKVSNLTPAPATTQNPVKIDF